MAKIPEGILSGIVGRVGSLIGSSWNGIPYIRIMPKKNRKRIPPRDSWRSVKNFR